MHMHAERRIQTGYGFMCILFTLIHHTVNQSVLGIDIHTRVHI